MATRFSAGGSRREPPLQATGKLYHLRMQMYMTLMFLWGLFFVNSEATLWSVSSMRLSKMVRFVHEIVQNDQVFISGVEGVQVRQSLLKVHPIYGSV